MFHRSAGLSAWLAAVVPGVFAFHALTPIQFGGQRTTSDVQDGLIPLSNDGSVDDIARAAGLAGISMRAWALANTTTYLQYLILSNLGGLGPESEVGFPGLVYGNVAKIGKNKDPVTLVWLNVTRYDGFDITKNGMWRDRLPGINIWNGSTTFRGVLLNCRTGKPVKVDTLSLTWMDLDVNDDDTGLQQIISNEHTRYQVADNTSLIIETLTDGSTSFTGSIRRLKHNAPQSPLNMTLEEMAGSVILTWRHVSSFHITLHVTGVSKKDYNPPGRTFKFASVGEAAFKANLSAADRERLMTVEASQNDHGLLIVAAVVGAVILALFACACCRFS